MDAMQGSLGQELEEALAQLEEGLSQAADGVRRLQAMAPRIGSLEGVLSAVQTALATGIAARPAPEALPDTTAPPPEPESEPAPDLPTASDETWSAPEADAGLPAEGSPEEPAAEAPGQGARCYLLNVESVGGSLDLRTVDQPIAEDPNVLDVALLDYDGKRATLKVWLSEDGDPSVIRDELEERLRSGSGWCVISLTEQAAA